MKGLFVKDLKLMMSQKNYFDSVMIKSENKGGVKKWDFLIY